MYYKKFKGQYWGEQERELISLLLQNKDNQVVITRVYNKLYPKLVYMSATLCKKYYASFFRDNYEEVVIDSLTYLFTNIWTLRDKPDVGNNYFSYIGMMLRNFYRLELRNDKTNNESIRDNTDVYNKPSSLLNRDELSEMYNTVDIPDIDSDTLDIDEFKSRVLTELHRLYKKYITIPERSWESAEVVLSKTNHQKRKKYLASAISYILEDFYGYSLEEMNNYIYENTDLEYQQVITQSYNFFKKQGLFEENARTGSNTSNISYLPEYKIITKQMSE